MVLWHKKVPSDTRGYEIAENAGALLSFDPNLRESLWNDLEEARERLLLPLYHF